MERITKSATLASEKTITDTELAKINEYTLTPLTADSVYVFSVRLCDTLVDRDMDRFTLKALKQLAGLFVGKTGIFNHSWLAGDQVCRVFEAKVKRLDDGEHAVYAKAYMLKNAETVPLIEKIEGGILKEVSVGFAATAECSICGKRLGWTKCENGHTRGEMVDGEKCVGVFNEVKDAYEFSFVAVPAQPAAGVTKSVQADVAKAVEVLLGAEKIEVDNARAIIEKMSALLLGNEERKKRDEIIAANKKLLESRR